MILIPILKNICVNPRDVTYVSIVDYLWVTVGIRGQEKPLAISYQDAADAEAALQQALRMLSEHDDQNECSVSYGESYGSKSEAACEAPIAEIGDSGTWTEEVHSHRLAEVPLDLRQLKAYRVQQIAPPYHVDLLWRDGVKTVVSDVTTAQIDDFFDAIRRSVDARKFDDDYVRLP